MLSNILSEFEGVGNSAIDLSIGLFSRRFHGGMAILSPNQSEINQRYIVIRIVVCWV